MSTSKRGISAATAEGWRIVVYETASGKLPALEYLAATEVPDQPRRELLLTILAVAEMGPLNFPTGTKRWRLMHKPAKKGAVDMSGIFEARDQHNRVLYRLFCLLDRGTPARGPAIVLLGGGTKPDRTEMPQRVYRTIHRHRQDYLETHRLSTVEQWPDWWPRPRN